MPYETIRLHTDERGVARVTLARPDKHNAMNARMIDELHRVATALADDLTIRVVILAGEGPTFCAGGDLGWMREQAGKDRDGKIAEARKLADMLGAWDALPQPTICRLHRAAYGGGLGLVAACDIVIAEEGVKMALTEVRLGLIPATIGPFVVGKLGPAFARQVFFNAKGFGAEFGLRAGLLARAVAAEDLDRAVQGEVSQLLECAPGAVAAAKALCRALTPSDPTHYATLTAEALANRWETDETRDGIAAFFDKKPPAWRQ